MTPTIVSHELARELQARVRGDVQFDAMSRALYATDASIYQIEPLGVVLPRDEQDVATVLQLARQHHVSVLPRGGATSLAGQTVGQAIQLDFSKYMNRVLEINAAEGWAWVEPGLVLDHLNDALAPHGVKFAPDVSPSNRATLGGMIANNSSGMYSLRYGKTIDHVLELKVMLSDGSVALLGPLDGDDLTAKFKLDSLEGRAYRTVSRLAREHAAEIEARFPKVLRRVGGYNLDAFVNRDQGSGVRGQDADNEHNDFLIPDPRPLISDPRPLTPFNLAKLLVGSEGTLGLILAAKVRIVPRPACTAISVVHFDSLDVALDAVVPCLECDPAAVELMDDILLGLTRTSLEYAKYLASFVQGEPHALLQVEFFGDTQADVVAQMDRLEAHLHTRVGALTITRALTTAEKTPILQVRKAGLPLLQSISPDRKPETFVEDSAVPPEKLAQYIRTFRDICHAHNVRVAFYGHASVGLMHARPLLNLKDPDDVRKMRAIAEQIKDLVIEYGGALSGEHGDGMLRAEFNSELFGATLYEAFREVKRTFDPHGLLNPGKVVDAPPMDTNLRYGGDYHTIPLQTHFHFRDTNGFAGAVELCNGNGLCRKTTGTMCPSYMVTKDEEHSTRGRANALRMVLSGALPPAELTGERMKDVMDLCLSCKGCTSECPSRVNMTRIKAEWQSRYYAEHGTPLRALLFGYIHVLSRIGSALAPLVNAALRFPGVNVINEKLLGVTRHRALPAFAGETLVQWFRSQESGVRGQGSGARQSSLAPDPRPLIPTVVLFPDTFANYNEPEIGKAAVRVLEAAGYHVILPSRAVCCGRPMLSKGLLDGVKKLARQQMEWLAPYAKAGIPIIGLEPSCILSFRDEYPDLLDDPRAVTLAQHSFLFDEFLHREISAGRTTLHLRGQGPGVGDQESDGDLLIPDPRPLAPRVFLLHGHCHQKALVGTAHALALLRMIPGAEVREVDSGCCGMAGSFGYEAEHYDISQQIGERALFPAVRALPPAAEIVAMGTSCRHQIADGTGRRARHLAEVLADALV